MNIYQAKQCALIAVDEIIEEVVESADNEVKSMRIIYWEKVKQEIEDIIGLDATATNPRPNLGEGVHQKTSRRSRLATQFTYHATKSASGRRS